MRRTCFGCLATSMPTTCSVPAVGRVSVAIVRISVVLPAPLGPSTASTLPDGTARSSPASASTSPKCFLRPSASIIMSMRGRYATPRDEPSEMRAMSFAAVFGQHL